MVGFLAMSGSSHGSVETPTAPPAIDSSAIGVVTLALQSVAPSFPVSETGQRSVDENTASDQNIGVPVAATDLDNDTLTYTLGGTDADAFGIVTTSGQLQTKAALDYESRDSYSVTVTATDTSSLSADIEVTITVNNVDEPGTVSLWPAEPHVGTVLRATLSDPDGGVSSESWQWSRSSSETISATDASYTPTFEDTGRYLRVAVEYSDAEGSGKSAEVVAQHVVGRREPAPAVSVQTLVSGLANPWGLAFAPDETMLFTQRGGTLSARLTNGTVQAVTADFSDLHSQGTAGLMAIVVDPDFTTNRRFYTCQGHTETNEDDEVANEVQVIAWTINDDYTAATRVNDPLVGGIPVGVGPAHAGCRMRFGPQGYLWIATGDGYEVSSAQDLSSLGGKVLRVDASTGDGATGNPFDSSPRVYTYGHRNPQGLALRPGTNQMWLVEHGPDWDDEINLLVSGGNYGWDPSLPDSPTVYNQAVPMTDLTKFPDAIEAQWSSGIPPIANSGAIFLEGDDWGEWNGRLAVATLKAESLRVFEFTADGEFVSQVVARELDGTYRRLRTPMLGPDDALYITTHYGGGDKILKVTVPFPPEFPTTESGNRSVDENTGPGQNIGELVAATDPKNKPITYWLTGPDAAAFDIVETSGQLQTKAALDFEAQATHMVTVNAGTGLLGAAQDVTITVNNVDEAGTLSLWPVEPRVGMVLQATLSDPDGGVSSTSWQWESSDDNITWTDLSHGEGSYTPTTDDLAKYLRASVSYSDAEGSGKSEQAVSAHQVAAREAAPDITVVGLVWGLSRPWDIAFTPDETMLFTLRRGLLRARLTDGTVQAVIADFRDLFASGNAGLMAIVVDPDFATNRRFYTCQGHKETNQDNEVQVIAWTINDAYTAATRANDPLVGGIPYGGAHAGCRMRFGPQGYLWIATGDGYKVSSAQDLSSLGGKVLRVDASTGDGATGNPFDSSPRVYTYGHRNPQGLALRPGTNQMWLVEHGPDWDDEINLLVSGGNYGWDPSLPDSPTVYNQAVPMTDLTKFPDAIEAKWSSGLSTLATSGGIFLEGDDWDQWNGRLAVATLKAESLRIFEFAADGALVSHIVVPELDDTEGRLRTPMLGPDGALYITTDNAGNSSKGILKIAPSRPPAFPIAETGQRGVDENTGSGQNIGAPVAATDPDSETLTYTLGGTDADAFDIVASSGQLQTKAALNYESQDSYSVTVTAADPYDLADDVDVTVTVSNVEESGTLSLSSLQPRIGEALSATLTDPDGSITGRVWQWEHSENGSDWSTIADATAADYSPVATDEGMYLRVSVEYTDGHGGNKSAATESERVTSFTVLVFTKTAGFRHTSIPDGIAAIGTLGLGNAFAVDATEDAGRFTDDGLVPYRAVIFLNTSGDVLDANQQGAFERYVRGGGGFVGIHGASATEYGWAWYGGLVGAYLHGHGAIQEGQLEVVDRVHPSTSHLPVRWERRDEWYNYRSSPRGRVRVLATLDEDSIDGDNNEGDHPIAWCHDYDGGRSWYTGGGHTDASFSEPDFMQHILGGIQYATGVTVADCSNSPPAVSGPLAVTHAEHDTTEVGTYSASDPESDPVAWSLSGDDAGRFSIDGGVLRFAAPPDFEDPVDDDGNNAYEVTVRASDGANTTPHAVTVTVDNVNEAPEVTGPVRVNHAENDTGVVAVYSAVDPENDDIEWSLQGSDREDFEISADGRLSFAATPDFEAAADSNRNNVYEVTVVASDGNKTGRRSVTITVEDVNEAPEVKGPVSVNHAENDTGVVASYSAVDPENDDIEWSLLGDDRQDFEISADGRLSFAAAPDFEAAVDSNRNNVYLVTVTATDPHGLAADIDVTITVEDVNEAPEVTGPVSENHTENDTSVVAVYSAVDPENQVILWSLLGDDREDFEIDADGRLRFAATPDFEAAVDSNRNNVYEVTVVASDDANTDTVDATITVEDVNEAPEVTGPVSVNHTENDTGVVAVYRATDPENQVILWSLLGDDREDFEIDADGRLSFAATPNFEAAVDSNRNNVYEVTVVASDATHTDTVDVVVTVGNIEEPGIVTLSSQPQAGTAITAALSDPDGAITGRSWVWERSRRLLSSSVRGARVCGGGVGEWGSCRELRDRIGCCWTRWACVGVWCVRGRCIGSWPRTGCGCSLMRCSRISSGLGAGRRCRVRWWRR